MRVGPRARLEARGAAAVEDGAVVAGAVARVDLGEGLAGELGERDAVTARERVAGGDGQDHRLVAQALADDAVARLGAEPSASSSSPLATCSASAPELS